MRNRCSRRKKASLSGHICGFSGLSLSVNVAGKRAAFYSDLPLSLRNLVYLLLFQASMKPYSTDLRRNILQACERGVGLQRAVAELFGLKRVFH